MKLAIASMSWEEKHDDIMYQYLSEHQISLEVTPARVFKWEESKISNRQVSPFEKYEFAEDWYRIVNTHYGINVASMHSLLYNINENMFVSPVYRRFLTNYLQSAIRFAVKIKCPNLCFGCAENRQIPQGMDLSDAADIAVEFFKELAGYAHENGVCLAIEPIAESDGTNFINYASQAFDLAKCVDSPGFKVNIDLGTIMENGEDINDIFTEEHLPDISHIHLSEPHLAPIQKRDIYVQTAELLDKLGYDRYVSVKLLEYPDVDLIQGAMNYFSGIFIR